MASRPRFSPLPKKALKIGLVQMTSVDNLEANVAAALRGLDSLRASGCRVICFPENALYFRLDGKGAMQAFDLRETFWRRFQDFANREKCVLVFGSIAYRKNKKSLTNATIVIEPKKKPRVAYEKIHLFDVDVPGAPPSRESDVFEHGKKPAVLTVDGWRLGLSICYDVRFAELYRHYARAKVHAILVPAAFLVPTGKAHWHVLLRARAIESQAYLVAAAQCGGHKNSAGQSRETFGHSLVINPWGEVELDLGPGGATTAAFSLEPKRLEEVRRQIPMEHHRRFRG